MNKFKKLVAVLVSVVMACVFATGVFATDYVENLSAARAEVNGYLTSAGVYGMDGVVNSLNETQLRALRDKSGALRNALTQAKNARNNREQNLGLTEHGWVIFENHERFDRECYQRSCRNLAGFSDEELRTYLAVQEHLNASFRQDVERSRRDFSEIPEK